MSEDGAGQQHPRRKRLWNSPLVHLMAAFLVLAFINGFLVKTYQVPSNSMAPTLSVSDRMLVNRIGNTLGDPEVGSVVVFNEPAEWGIDRERSPFRTVVGWVGDFFGIGPSNHHALVKRIVAGPGQTVECCDTEGRLLVDGAPQDTPEPEYDWAFTEGSLDCDTTPASMRCFEPFTVPEDSYLVLGDNRGNSLDSLGKCRSDDVPNIAECVRLVPKTAVVGEVSLIVWPFDHFGAPESLS